MTSPNASVTARERARAELTREIKEEAKRQLAVAGADGLSLRAVARSLGMVSSALYRYFPSRDDLLTALIIDAYNSLGAAVEQAASPRAAGGGTCAREEGTCAGAREEGTCAGAREEGTCARARWRAGCAAVRAWATANAHEYALIYGSPVPGYRAPEATIAPAARVPLAFAGILRDAVADGALPGGTVPGGTVLAGELAEQAAATGAALANIARDGSGDCGAAVPHDVLVRGVIAWTQLFGMVSFELFGQFVGSFDPPDAFFSHAVEQMATFVGL